MPPLTMQKEGLGTRPRDNQNTHIQNPLGLGNPGASHQGARVTLWCLATPGHDKEVVGHALFF